MPRKKPVGETTNVYISTGTQAVNSAWRNQIIKVTLPVNCRDKCNSSY